MTPSGDCSHAPHVLANSWGAGAPPIPSSVFHRRRCRFGADELRLQTTGGPCVPCSALSATIRLPRAVEATGFEPDQLRAYSKRLTRLDEPADAELLLQNANSTQTPIHLLQTRNDSLQTPTHWDTGHFFHRLRYAALQELSGAGRLIRRLCEPHSDTPTFSRRCGPLELEKRAAERASWRSAIRQLNGTRLVLARGNSLANSAAVAPDAGTLASRAIRLNKERGSGIREEAIRDTLCTGVTLLT